MPRPCLDRATSKPTMPAPVPRPRLKALNGLKGFKGIYGFYASTPYARPRPRPRPCPVPRAPRPVPRAPTPCHGHSLARATATPPRTLMWVNSRSILGQFSVNWRNPFPGGHPFLSYPRASTLNFGVLIKRLPKILFI